MDELMDLKASMSSSDNFIIIIYQDGSQTFYNVTENHLKSLQEITEKYYTEINRLVVEKDLDEYTEIIEEYLSQGLIVVVKSVDTYGVYLPIDYTKKQKKQLSKDMLVINASDDIYSGIYDKNTNDLFYLNDGNYLKKMKFICEINKRKKMRILKI